MEACKEFGKRDVRQYAAMVEELEKAQQMNALILEGATDYIYQLDLENDTCTFSPHALDVLPLESATFSNALETCLSFVVPEDRKVFLDSFTPFLTGTSDYHKAEYRVMTKQGTVMWISCNGKGLHDGQGNPLMIAGSLMDITERKVTEEKMQKMLYFDDVTQMKNRHGFDADMLLRLEQPGATGAIVYIDIKNFKMINEIFGHGFGNVVLCEMTKLFQLLLPGNLGIYRISGDEFIVHLPYSEKEEIQRNLKTLLLRLRQPIIMEKRSVYITLNMGVSIYPDHGQAPEILLQNAYVPMVNCSKTTKHHIAFYEDSESEGVSRGYQLEHELRRSITHNFENFRLVYQPIVDCATGVWRGGEALLRFVSPTLGPVPIEEVIEILERTTLIVSVGKWVLRNAMLECIRWHEQGYTDMVVHVNCSAIQTNDPQYIRVLKETLEKFQFPGEKIVCELTETILVDNMDCANYFCKALKKLGVKIALDDFGIGYSSLSYLRKLPIDEIKIDKSFALEFDSDPYYAAAISTVNTLAESLDMDVCVEGVETQAVYHQLKKMNIKVLQGFYFAKPLEADDFYQQLERATKEKS